MIFCRAEGQRGKRGKEGEREGEKTIEKKEAKEKENENDENEREREGEGEGEGEEGRTESRKSIVYSIESRQWNPF